jgi:hypothetical protein
MTIRSIPEELWNNRVLQQAMRHADETQKDIAKRETKKHAGERRKKRENSIEWEKS